jgi:hypothetical protein
MAKDRLPQIHTIHITTASRILAQLRARKAVKRELQKQGLKPAHYSAREITSWSMLYLEDHAAELMPAAIEQARAMILRGDRQAGAACLSASAVFAKLQNSEH